MGGGVFAGGAAMHPSSSQLSDPQKLSIYVGNCVQKAAELILHARVSPRGERGAVNHWVRPGLAHLPLSLSHARYVRSLPPHSLVSSTRIS